MRKARALTLGLVLLFVASLSHATDIFFQGLTPGGTAALDTVTNLMLISKAPLDLISLNSINPAPFGGYFNLNTGTSTGTNNLGPTYTGGEIEIFAPGDVPVFDGHFSSAQLQSAFDANNNAVLITYFGTLDPANSMFLGPAAGLNPLASGTVANASIMINSFTDPASGDTILVGFSSQSFIALHTPEPASMTLLLFGIGGLGLRRKFHRTKG